MNTNEHRSAVPFLAFVVACWLAAGSIFAADPADRTMLPPDFRKLVPLHQPLGKPLPGDWLSEHPEPGQNYRQYLRAQPVKIDAKRRVIYVQPLGELSDTQRKIIDLTARHMAIYFDLPVKIRDGVALDAVPRSARRPGPLGSQQILTTYLLYDVLRPRLPKDAVVIIGLTATDLWPGEGWNYVFGQASLSDRVGVWSIHRNGNPDAGEAALRLCLLRTMKTATHETGHMFSMAHCTLYACNMCGCNHLGESDRRPLALCPHCLAKLCYATGANPTKRFEQLIQFYRVHGLAAEQQISEKSLALLRSK